MNNFDILNEKYALPESKLKSRQFLEKYYYSGNIDTFLLENLDTKVFFEELGGCILTEKELDYLKKFMIKNNDLSFYIIELDGSENIPFKFKFPVDINWIDLNNGGGISYEIFRPIRKYLITTDQKNWFRIIDNDAINPIQITYANNKNTLEKLKNSLKIIR